MICDAPFGLPAVPAVQTCGGRRQPADSVTHPGQPGFATNETFDSQRSDLDNLVKFAPDAPMGPFCQYFDFLAELKRLFGREVDLVEARAMWNPYFIKSVNATRKPVYQLEEV